MDGIVGPLSNIITDGSALLAGVLDATPEAILLLGLDTRLVAANAAACRLLLAAPPPAEGMALNAWLRASGLGAAARDNLLDACKAHCENAAQVTATPFDLIFRQVGTAFWHVTVRHRDRAPTAANVDALTALPNRAVFREALEAALAGGGGRAAVLLLDLDRFKEVNDGMGHPLGDALLIAVAERLRTAVRARDLPARLGGDEFAILIGECDTEAESTGLAARLVDLIARPYFLNGYVATIGVSIGIALAPNDATEADELIRNADLALYDAKACGRGTWRRYEPRLSERVQARLQMEGDLRKALALRQFRLFYQAQFDLSTRKLTGFEALIRWAHPVRGLVSPLEFIPVLEELGLIGGVGAWALRTACAEAVTWPYPYSVAVNVSPWQFEHGDELVDAVADALRRSGMPGERLELEITESALLQNETRTLKTLHALRALGPRIAMDDFGTGYSSLSQLRSFPFDKIKIDRSFVTGVAHDAQAGAIVRAINALGASLGMTTIAEGVETEEQASALLRDGCPDIQGYLISRPVPPDALPALILSHTHPAPGAAAPSLASHHTTLN